MFKKMIMLITLLTLLTACSNDEETAKANEIIENPNEATSSDNNAERVNENAASDEAASLPEYQTVLDEVDDRKYVFKLVTDNEGKRIFFLTDEKGIKQYKSIFIKETNHLKIIDLESNDEIFNDKI